MTAWSGDWSARVLERVSAAGFESVLAFCAKYPTATYVELAEKLGQDVAAVQVERSARVEAEKASRIDDFLRDSLVRVMHARMPEGWGVGQRAEFKLARTRASWVGVVGDDLAERARGVWANLNVSAPTGWIPSGLDDQVLTAAFAV